MTPSALDAFAIAKASLPEVSVRRGSAPAPSSREQTEALFLVAARISGVIPAASLAFRLSPRFM